MKKYLLILLIVFANRANSETYIAYSTHLHPKSAGADISVNYPSSWQKEESRAPHTVQKFVKLYPEHKATMTIQVLSIPKNQLDQMRKMKLEGYIKTLRNFGKVVSYKKFKVSNFDGFQGDVIMYDHSGVISSLQKIRIVNALANGNWLGFWCGVTTSATTEMDELSSKFSSIETECNKFIQSVEIK